VILDTDERVRAKAIELHERQRGCVWDIDGWVSQCEAITPNPHEAAARAEVARLYGRCMAHGEIEPCGTCRSYIAAGL
jgi:hypothetical protein